MTGFSYDGLLGASKEPPPNKTSNRSGNGEKWNLTEINTVENTMLGGPCSVQGITPACLCAQTSRLWVSPFVHLYVRLCEGNHLGKYLLAVEVSHLVPLPASLVQHMHLVGTSLWFSIMDNVCHQVICSSLCVLGFYLFRKQISKLNAFDRKVDNGGILFNKEGVFGEPLDVEDDEPGELDQLKSLQEIVLVCLVLLLFNSIELG